LVSNLGSKDYVICFDKKYVATKEIKDNLNISIFPNPFDNQILIQNNNTQHISYQLFTIQGQLLQQGKVFAENRQTLQVDFLPKGIYFIALKDENGAWKMEKLIK
jgi:hypothetical protein